MYYSMADVRVRPLRAASRARNYEHGCLLQIRGHPAERLNRDDAR